MATKRPAIAHKEIVAAIRFTSAEVSVVAAIAAQHKHLSLDCFQLRYNALDKSG